MSPSLRNQWAAWQAVKRGKGNAYTQEKEPNVKIGCHDWWARKSEEPQQFGRSDTVRINVAFFKQSSETVTITPIARA